MAKKRFVAEQIVGVLVCDENIMTVDNSTNVGILVTFVDKLEYDDFILLE